MPRRLGDDPLTRARSERAKAAASATVALESGGQQGTAQLGIQPRSRSSYNDVFFQRRSDASNPPQEAAQVPGATEAPEISEISEIPEIREAAAASVSEPPFVATPIAETASVAAPEAEAIQVVQASPVSIVEEVAAEANTQATDSASTAIGVPQTQGEPSSPSAPDAPGNTADGSKQEPQKSAGFFKRLFGKFK